MAITQTDRASQTDLGAQAEAELSDAVSESFFAEGLRQEAEGLWREPSRVAFRGSLDRPARHWSPVLVFVFVLLGSGGMAAAWASLRSPAVEDGPTPAAAPTTTNAAPAPRAAAAPASEPARLAFVENKASETAAERPPRQVARGRMARKFDADQIQISKSRRHKARRAAARTR
jgi:hypothetical protein